MKTGTRLLRIGTLMLVTAAILVSCEKVVDISIPDQERKIVVNGSISPEYPVSITLSISRSILESDTMILARGGQVRLYHGSEAIGTLNETGSGVYALPGFLPEVGETYRLAASWGELAPVETEATLPAEVPILQVDTASLFGEWGWQELKVTVRFRDPVADRNYYGFSAEVTYKEWDYMTMEFTGRKLTHTAYLTSQDDRFLKDESTEFEGKLYFSDAVFNGSEKNVTFGINDYALFESDTVWLAIKMEQVEQARYRYVLSYRAYQDAHGNPFAEPVPVYSNVKGGYGIFTGSSTASRTLVLRDFRKN